MSEGTKARRAVLVILDGFGINPDPMHNAIAQAKTPHLDRIMKEFPHTQLEASEAHVGLPPGFMGNSEVGHLNIGAGRVVYQDFSLISKAIEDKSFFENPEFLKLFEAMRGGKRPGALHLMGLVSDGGVHSHLSHLFALTQLASRQGVSQVYVHVFLDGRDTSPTSGRGFLQELQAYLRDSGLGEIATVQGRFYAMDRDSRWERTQAAFDAICVGQSATPLGDPMEWVTHCYEDRITDEFIPPAVAKGYAGVQDGDGMIFFNFRADRARQLTRAFTQAEFPYFPRARTPKLAGFVMMTPYDASIATPHAFGKPIVPNTLGEFVSRQGWKQLRIAETEKYAHVTYFFNGGEEKVFEGEKRVLVPSPREVRTYDLKPEMSAEAVTDQLLAEVSSTPYQLVVVNYANCDMVGHTGNLRAAILAVESVDRCLGRLLEWLDSTGGFALITADHGNCEQMIDPEGNPLTSHTTLPVPFVVVDAQRKSLRLRDRGRLCDIAPTLIELWGLKPPAEMTGQSLVSR